MKIEWNSAKASLNLKKHHVSFELAATVFDDPLAVSVPDTGQYSEERWVTLGLAVNQRTLVVVHTLPSSHSGIEIMRIISARKATPRERRQYEKGI